MDRWAADPGCLESAVVRDPAATFRPAIEIFIRSSDLLPIYIPRSIHIPQKREDGCPFDEARGFDARFDGLRQEIGPVRSHIGLCAFSKHGGLDGRDVRRCPDLDLATSLLPLHVFLEASGASLASLAVEISRYPTM